MQIAACVEIRVESASLQHMVYTACKFRFQFQVPPLELGMRSGEVARRKNLMHSDEEDSDVGALNICS